MLFGTVYCINIHISRGTMNSFQMKAFTESCVMVRKPALEILKCMNATSYELPVVRYLLCILAKLSMYGIQHACCSCTLYIAL